MKSKVGLLALAVAGGLGAYAVMNGKQAGAASTKETAFTIILLAPAIPADAMTAISQIAAQLNLGSIREPSLVPSSNGVISFTAIGATPHGIEGKDLVVQGIPMRVQSVSEAPINV